MPEVATTTGVSTCAAAAYSEHPYWMKGSPCDSIFTGLEATMQLVTYLNFDGNCAQAFRFYESCLGGHLDV